MKLLRYSVTAVLAFGVTIALTAAPAAAKTFKVNPGDSIQAAVDAASDGDKIVVYPGTYTETGSPHAVVVNKSLKMIAKVDKKAPGDTGKVIILGDGSQQDGVLVEPPNPGDPDIEGFLIKGFTIQGFQNNGIHLRYVHNFKILKNESIDNLENGIWPTLSAKGMVKKNVSYGSQDSAMWVEASEDVRVIRNVAYSSPTGIEVTVSNGVDIKKNEAYNNSIGMGLYHPSAAGLPPLPTNGFWKVQKNSIHDNNAPNTAPPGSMAAEIPPGGGVLILGADDILLKSNQIENNDFFGLAIIDYCLAVGGSAFDCTLVPPVVEPVPERDIIIGNKFVNNGTNPPPTHPLAFAAADMIYIVDFGGGAGNCFSKNVYDTRTFLLANPAIGGCSPLF